MSEAWPDGIFASTRPDSGARLRLVDGGELVLNLHRWHELPNLADRDALTHAIGPVIDIGCGPGRHLRALLDRRHEALGIDSSPAAIRAARRRGTPAVEASVWGPIPAPGHWQTALLLDGNIGIGGDPEALLRRVCELLDTPQRVIVELIGDRAGSHLVRVEHGTEIGPWFWWATVSPATIGKTAAASGMIVDHLWDRSGRWFAVLSKDADALPEEDQSA